MALLQQNPMQQQGQEAMPVNENGDMIEDAIESSGATIDADQIAGAIMDNMDDKQRENTGHFVDSGKELLFGEETHYQLMDSLKTSKDMTKDLGYGAYQLMMALLQQGGMTAQDRPDITPVIIPSGVILMALTAEFMNSSDEFPDITLDQFGEAADIFVNMMLQHDPEFMQNANAESGMQQEPQQDMLQQQQPQAGLLANQQGV